MDIQDYVVRSTSQAPWTHRAEQHRHGEEDRIHVKIQLLSWALHAPSTPDCSRQGATVTRCCRLSHDIAAKSILLYYGHHSTENIFRFFYLSKLTGGQHGVYICNVQALYQAKLS
jgi:hypothetical protein